MSSSERHAVFARLRGRLDVRARHPERAGSGLPAARVLPTGLPALDDELGGGLPRGALTELVCAAPSCGGQLWLAHLLAGARQARQRVALIDGGDGFDPASHASDLYAHLVWVRCRTVAAALQAADVVARDANFGLVVLDLKPAAPRELRRTPATTWYRLQRAAEPAALALVVITARAVVPSAQLRLELGTSFTAAAFARERAALVARLAPVVQRQRWAAGLEAAAG